MKIRTITLGINIDSQTGSPEYPNVKEFFRHANKMFSKYNFESRTQRIALPPFTVSNSAEAESILSTVEKVSSLCKENGIRWFCIPFNTFDQDMERLNSVAVKFADKYKNAFINYILVQDNQLMRKSAWYAGRFVNAVAGLTENGFDNFRCGVSFNCKANGAYFPFTHHSGANGFSIALEMTPVIVEVIKNNSGRDLEHLRDTIIFGRPVYW